MDPKACILRYLAAFADDDRDEMSDAADDYNGWISRGGFPHAGMPFTVWGLSGNWSEGVPQSPVAVGAALIDAFVTPTTLSDMVTA